jgi:site-specific recombinase XerD
MRPQAIQWQIVDKETVDQIILKTMNIRNRIMLELMVRGGMRIGEVLNLKSADIQERTWHLKNTELFSSHQASSIHSIVVISLQLISVMPHLEF